MKAWKLRLGKRELSGQAGELQSESAGHRVSIKLGHSGAGLCLRLSGAFRHEYHDGSVSRKVARHDSTVRMDWLLSTE
jgi:hypothetical protein